MRNTGAENRIRLRSVFISDVHLGSRDCRATELLTFLDSIEVETLFLVGDIIDLWSLRRTFYWPREHGDVVRAILARARAGTRVIYIPGNHDEDMRPLCGSVFGNLQIRRDYVHVTAAGRELLVTHGDELDAAVKFSPWLARLGGGAYALAMWLNRRVNACRRALGLPFWSLANYLKPRLGNAVRYVDAFERAAAGLAAQRGLQGVICGHIHRAGIREIDGISYCNDGDWVESCTALVEEKSGQLSLCSWTQPEQASSHKEVIEVAA
jgi:UDP-2,3-diacylglucosamine pyrophosphatase LpxH